MKTLLVIFLFINSISFSQTSIIGDWSLTCSSENKHPLKEDTIKIEKLNNIHFKLFSNINLLTFSEFGEANYDHGCSQEIINLNDTNKIKDKNNFAILEGIRTTTKDDSITSQFSNLKYLIYNDTLQLIFFNKYWPLTESEIRLLSKQELKNRFLNFGKSFLLYYKIILQTEKELKLVKLNLL